MTKAEEVRQRVDALMAQGTSRAEALKQVAEHYGQPVNSIRGAYYTKPGGSGESSKPRRRETTLEAAMDDARRALERALENVDREVEAAKGRADEANAEYEALKGSASERKQAIQQRLEALQ